MEDKNIKQFWNLLFDEGDWTCIEDTTYGTRTNPITKGYRMENEFFVINPLAKQTKRAIKNVTKFRNFLFEIDEDKDENPVPKNIQRDIVKASGIPISTIVFSGGKSLHWILSLEVPVEDALEYKAIWKTTFAILNEAAIGLGYNLKFDPNVKDPSRFSRCPGALRTDSGKIQDLVGVRSRVNNEILYDWFTSKGKDWSDEMPKGNSIGLEVWNPDASQDERINHVMKHLMKNMEYVQGSKNQYQFTYARLLRATGLNDMEVTSHFNSHFDKIDHRDPIGSAFSSNYDNDKQIYVWSKAEKIAYMQAKEQDRSDLNAREMALTVQEEPSGVLENGELADINSGGLLNYIRVGTKYYRADGYSINMWDKQTIKDDFGNQALHSEDLRKYRAFTNEPSYIKRIDHITIIDSLGEPQSFYNRFYYPNWNLVKGEFPTIMKLLKKAFGAHEDHLEIGLDWIQLMITKPKQRKRAIVLVGPPETGKDTFMEFLISLVGSNGILLNGEEIESPFNTGWIGKHLVCLNEVNYDLADKKTKERIKNLLTSEKITVEGKGENQYQIENHTNIIMATNNMYDFMKIDSKENRFHVLEMVQLNTEDRDPDFKSKIDKEMMPFANWIVNERQLWRTEKDGRFWHTNEECFTEAGRRVVENTRSNLYSELESLFVDKFKHESLRGKDVMYVRASTLLQALSSHMIQNNSNKSYNQKAVKMCLLKEFNCRDLKNIREDAFDNFSSSNNQFFEVDIKNIGV